MTKFQCLAALLATAVSFWLLLGTQHFMGRGTGGIRLYLAAGLLGVYTYLCAVDRGNPLGNTMVHVIVVCASAVVAFGIHPSGWKKSIVYSMMLLSLEGLASGADAMQYLWLLVFLGAVSLLCRWCPRERNTHKEYVDVEVVHRGQKTRFTALMDTGNMLTDPFTGEPVLILGGEDALTLSGLTREQIRDPFQTILERPVSGLRLIPYRSLGNNCGFLLGMRFTEVSINGGKGESVIAFTADAFGRRENFQALVGGIAC